MNKTILTSLMLTLCCGVCLGEDWGTVTGRIVFEGAAISPAALNVTKDQEVCGKHNLVDESIVVGPDNGLANVAVYLYLKRGASPPAIHESYEESASSEVRLDNENCRFEPHLTFLRTTQTLLIGNKDSVGHNTKIVVGCGRRRNTRGRM